MPEANSVKLSNYKYKARILFLKATSENLREVKFIEKNVDNVRWDGVLE